MTSFRPPNEIVSDAQSIQQGEEPLVYGIFHGDHLQQLAQQTDMVVLTVENGALCLSGIETPVAQPLQIAHAHMVLESELAAARLGDTREPLVLSELWTPKEPLYHLGIALTASSIRKQHLTTQECETLWAQIHSPQALPRSTSSDPAWRPPRTLY